MAKSARVVLACMPAVHRSTCSAEGKRVCVVPSAAKERDAYLLMTLEPVPLQRKSGKRHKSGAINRCPVRSTVKSRGRARLMHAVQCGRDGGGAGHVSDSVGTEGRA